MYLQFFGTLYHLVSFKKGIIFTDLQRSVSDCYTLLTSVL